MQEQSSRVTTGILHIQKATSIPQNRRRKEKRKNPELQVQTNLLIPAQSYHQFISSSSSSNTAFSLIPLSCIAYPYPPLRVRVFPYPLLSSHIPAPARGSIPQLSTLASPLLELSLIQLSLLCGVPFFIFLEDWRWISWERKLVLDARSGCSVL